jgi:hypothetical protein
LQYKSLKGLATRLSKYSLTQKLKFLMKVVKVTVSEVTLEEKPNCMKIIIYKGAITRYFKMELSFFAYLGAHQA